MYSVGIINKTIYSCITKDIVNDEIIITDNQLQHIKDRHPEAYDNVLDNISMVIMEPDYIFEDKHSNTGLVIKRLNTEAEHIQIVLRICTSSDESGYKNSIISSWEISEKRLQNYLRNKRLLYKRE